MDAQHPVGAESGDGVRTVYNPLLTAPRSKHLSLRQQNGKSVLLAGSFSKVVEWLVFDNNGEISASDASYPLDCTPHPMQAWASSVTSCLCCRIMARQGISFGRSRADISGARPP